MPLSFRPVTDTKWLDRVMLVKRLSLADHGRG